MIIGYARVSTEDQSLDSQVDALKEYGCDKIFTEKASGVSSLEKKKLALSILEEGDVLVVWKLDRMARSTLILLRDIEEIQSKRANFVSLRDQIDTSTAAGRFQFIVFSAIAEFERGIISERTKAGLEAARLRGRKGGRPRGSSKETLVKFRLATELVSGGKSASTACREVGLGKTTYYQLLSKTDNLERK